MTAAAACACAGLYIVTAGTDGLVAVWADEGKACISKRQCETPVAAACWHPTSNALALQVTGSTGQHCVKVPACIPYLPLSHV